MVPCSLAIGSIHYYVSLRNAIAPFVYPCTIGCSCGGDIAIAVVVYTLIECLLAAPVFTAVLVFCWKRNQRYV